jgi:transcription elongation GreA/GreB family factor
MAWLCALAAALAIGVVVAMFRVMSVAFTREEDLEATAADLADRPISPHPNLVTPEGLAAIEAELASARAAYTAAQVQGSIESDRTAMARATRDLRYWSARRASAQLIAPTEDDGAVRFGGSVSIEREDGRAQTWRIVGEDEADPAAGSVSHVSPLARAVMGKRVGDEVTVAGQSAEIVAVG